MVNLVDYWHCPPSVWNMVYATVGRPSVYLSHHAVPHCQNTYLFSSVINTLAFITACACC